MDRYRVTIPFADLQDNGYVYSVGDEFPRQGTVASKDRLAELAGDKNRQGKPLIEKIMVEKPKKSKK